MSGTGIPRQSLFFATTLASAIFTFLMGLCEYPL